MDNKEKLIKELKLVIIFAVAALFLIAATAVFFVISAHAKDNAALSAGEIIKYENAQYKVDKINHKGTYAFICPHYDYRRFFSSSNWGWFYGKDCKWINIALYRKSQNKALKHKTGFNPKLATNDNYLNSLTAKQFKKYYVDMTQTAVMRPTQTNIARYTYMTNFMRQKSLQFAYAYYTYVLNHPKYDIAAKVGTTSWSYRTTFNYSAAEKKIYIKRHLNHIGLFFFFSGADNYSLKQVPIINWILNDYGITIIGVSDNSCPSNLDTKCMVNPAAFTTYKVKSVPEIIMIYRKKDGSPVLQIIGSGLTPESTIISRIFFYLHSYKKIYYKNNNFKTISGSPYLGK